MRKITILVLLALMVFSPLSTIDGKNHESKNAMGVTINKSEIARLSNMGLSDAEINVLSNKEKDRYLDMHLGTPTVSYRYEKIERITRNGVSINVPIN